MHRHGELAEQHVSAKQSVFKNHQSSLASLQLSQSWKGTKDRGERWGGGVGGELFGRGLPKDVNTPDAMPHTA